MLSYCFKCKTNTKRKKLGVSKTSNGKRILSSKCALRNSKQSRFINEPKIRELSNKLGIRNPLSKILFSVEILF